MEGIEIVTEMSAGPRDIHMRGVVLGLAPQLFEIQYAKRRYTIAIPPTAMLVPFALCSDYNGNQRFRPYAPWAFCATRDYENISPLRMPNLFKNGQVCMHVTSPPLREDELQSAAVKTTLDFFGSPFNSGMQYRRGEVLPGIEGGSWSRTLEKWERRTRDYGIEGAAVFNWLDPAVTTQLRTTVRTFLEGQLGLARAMRI